MEEFSEQKAIDISNKLNECLFNITYKFIELNKKYFNEKEIIYFINRSSINYIIINLIYLVELLKDKTIKIEFLNTVKNTLNNDIEKIIKDINNEKNNIK